MQQNLFRFGFDERYYIDETGTITDSKRQRVCKSKKNIFCLLNKHGKYQKISLKSLYREVFGREYCIDNTVSFPDEEWKTLDIDSRYSASSHGRIKSRCGYKARILKPGLMPNGYLRVEIRGKQYFIHRLVFEAFTREKAETIHHIDYNKQNNSISNLTGMGRAEHAKKTQQDRKNRIQ